MSDVWVGHSDLFDYALGQTISVSSARALVQRMLLRWPELLGWHEGEESAEGVIGAIVDPAELRELGTRPMPADGICEGVRVALRSNPNMLGRVVEEPADGVVQLVWDADADGPAGHEDEVPATLLTRVYVAYDSADMLALGELADKLTGSDEYATHMRAILSEDSDEYPSEGALECLLDDLPYAIERHHYPVTSVRLDDGELIYHVAWELV